MRSTYAAHEAMRAALIIETDARQRIAARALAREAARKTQAARRAGIIRSAALAAVASALIGGACAAAFL